MISGNASRKIGKESNGGKAVGHCATSNCGGSDKRAARASGSAADSVTASANASYGEQRLTEDLLERLLASAKVETYLDDVQPVDRSLPDYLYELLRKRGLKRADVQRGSGLNATVVYDIFDGKSKPGRDHAIMLAFGLRCTVQEAQRLLRMAGVSELWCKIRRDALIIWCIDHGYTRVATDDELFRFGEKTLLGTDRLR
jgi:hypothetical protein